ncbi:hypothetical protein [Rhodovulum sp. PH10]|uniref:hypothetical protein n=1 Tax=Rhodovulum sp. PH10 TaxID=1187851 RepID=UPI00192BD13D|nr:hypothetical protein [Rhodovulum sp. PH10]
MRPFALLLGATLALTATAPALSDVLIASDTGGMIGDYVARYERVRASGDRVVIDGTCLSACTLVVGLIPRGRLCATRNAVLGFHAAWVPGPYGDRVTSPVATRTLWGFYPAGVRRWITRHGGLTPDMLMLRGRELSAIVPPCDGPAVRAAAVGGRAYAGRGRAARRAARAIPTPAAAGVAMAR